MIVQARDRFAGLLFEALVRDARLDCVPTRHPAHGGAAVRKALVDLVEVGLVQHEGELGAPVRAQAADLHASPERLRPVGRDDTDDVDPRLGVTDWVGDRERLRVRGAGREDEGLGDDE